jgi:hypothetical protein
MAAPAARHKDIVKHESKMLGFFAGAIAGALFGILVLSTGGLALAAVVAVGAAGGYVAGAAWDAFFAESPGVETGALGIDTTEILINDEVAAAVLCKSPCYFPVVYNHDEKVVSTGSSTVFFACRPAARQGDTLICDAKISSGSPNVIIGGGTVRIAGSKKTNFDYFLDYASLYLTVALGGASLATLAVSATAVGISEIVSVNELFGAFTPVATNVINSAGSLFNIYRIENPAARSHNAGLLAGQRAEVQNAMYQRYVRRKAALGQPYQMQSEWARNNRVQWALDRRVAKAGPPKGMKSLTGWKGASFQVGLPIIVDVARMLRENARERNVPENPLKVSCDNTSWLEPA